LALGVAGNPSALRRRGALIAIAVLVIVASERGVRRAFVPTKGLRELAAEASATCGPGDQVVLLRAMDYGLRPYWPDLKAAHPLNINQTQPIEGQLSVLRARLDSLGPSACVLLIYRDDYYFDAFPAQVSAILSTFRSRGISLKETWRAGDLLMFEGTRVQRKTGAAQ
jgi:hypothetical protein